MINLLPPEIKARLARRRFNGLLAKIGIALVTLEVAGLGILWAWQLTAQETLTLMEERVASLRLNLESFNDVREQALLIADRTADYQTITSQLTDWAAVLADLAAATRSDISLTSFKTSRSGSTTTVSLSGEAGSRASVIGFREALEKSPSFSNMVFNESLLIDTERGRVNFSLTGELEKRNPTTKEKP